jgi:peptidoglycan/xylan/chitin deacetylase (PgdA/CDA1 family)
LGSPAVNVRDCPSFACDVIGTVTVSDRVEITGEQTDGFYPIRFNSLSGYAYSLYISPLPDPAPYFFRGEPGCNRVAIIFNVGVGYEFDLPTLDILEQYDVPATFFVMRWWAEQNPDLLRELVARGYPIGSHGDMPLDLSLTSDADVIADIQSAEAKIRAIIGDDLGPWLTPFAASGDERTRVIISGQGYLPVGWEVPAADYEADADPNAIWERVVPNIYDGAIIEMHIDAPATAAGTRVALPWVIDALSQRGYQFVTIPELVLPCGVDPAVLNSTPAATPTTSVARPTSHRSIGAPPPPTGPQGSPPDRRAVG